MRDTAICESSISEVQVARNTAMTRLEWNRNDLA
jgi:hypothetical protein